MIGNLPGLKLAELGVGNITEGCSTSSTLFGKELHCFTRTEDKWSGYITCIIHHSQLAQQVVRVHSSSYSQFISYIIECFLTLVGGEWKPRMQQIVI